MSQNEKRHEFNQIVSLHYVNDQNGNAIEDDKKCILKRKL